MRTIEQFCAMIGGTNENKAGSMSVTKLFLFVCFQIVICSAQAQTESWLKLERIDVQPNGLGTATRYALKSNSMSISDNGRWVIFASDASDLVAGDSNGKSDIFVRDRATNSTRRLSLRPGGVQTTQDSNNSNASSDGRFVTFFSFDSLLVANDTNSTYDQFLLDRDSDGNGIFDEPGGTLVELVSLNNAGTTFFNGARRLTSVVNNQGTSVAFGTLQPLVASDTNSKQDVYMRSRGAAETRLMSQTTTGVIGNNDSPDFYAPPLRMSEDGARLAFSSDASNLAAGDANAAPDVYLRDRDTDGNGVLDEPGGVATRLVSVGPGGTQIPMGPFLQFDLSGNGRWLAFTAFNAAGPNPSGSDIYLHALESGVVAPVNFVASQWAKGGGTCCGNQFPMLSRNGEIVVFTSGQNYTFPGNVTGGRNDVFAKPRNGPLVRLTDFPVPAAQNDGHSFGASAMSRNGGYLIIGISAADSVSAGPNDGYFVYQRDVIFASGFE